MSYQGLDHLIKGRRKLTDDFLIQVSSLTGCSIHWLVTAEGPKRVVAGTSIAAPSGGTDEINSELRLAIRREIVEVLGAMAAGLSKNERDLAESIIKTARKHPRSPKG
jgi:hypothetical protein